MYLSFNLPDELVTINKELLFKLEKDICDGINNCILNKYE